MYNARALPTRTHEVRMIETRPEGAAGINKKYVRVYALSPNPAGTHPTRYLIGLLDDEQAVYRLQDALERRLGIKTETGSEEARDPESMTVCQIVIEKAPNGIEMSLVRPLPHQNRALGIAKTTPVFKLNESEVLVEVWRGPEHWSRWDAVSRIRQVLRLSSKKE